MSANDSHVAKPYRYGASVGEVAREVLRQAVAGSVNEAGILEWCNQLAAYHEVAPAEFIREVAGCVPRHVSSNTLSRLRPQLRFLGV